jgi:hypothetical protein
MREDLYFFVFIYNILLQEKKTFNWSLICIKNSFKLLPNIIKNILKPQIKITYLEHLNNNFIIHVTISIKQDLEYFLCDRKMISKI